MESIILEDDGTTEKQSNAADAQDVDQQDEEGASSGLQDKNDATEGGAGAEKAEGDAEGVEKQAEPTIEVEGKVVPLSKVKQALQDAENDQSWKDKNRRESEFNNKERERLRRLELLEPLIEKDPSILQKLFSQTPQRDFDAEIAEHHSKRPDEFADNTARSAWEIKGQQLVAEKLKAETHAEIEQARFKAECEMHNNRIDASAREKYVATKKVTQEEYDRMTGFILENTNARYTGKAPEMAYDMAYRMLFGDRHARDIRADAVKRTTEPIRKATTGGADAGLNQRTPQLSAEDAEDAEFISRVKTQTKGKYTPLP